MKFLGPAADTACLLPSIDIAGNRETQIPQHRDSQKQHKG